MLLVNVLDRIPLVRDARKILFPTRQELRRKLHHLRARIAHITADVTHLEKRHCKHNPLGKNPNKETFERNTDELERIYKGRIELHTLGLQADRLEKKLRRL